MSCLYSSPEVWIVVVAVDSPDPARVMRTGQQRSLIPDKFCRTSRSTKTRSQQTSRYRWLHQFIPPARTSTGFSRDRSNAISGFRSLCGRKQRSSLKPSRSTGPAFWNLSLGAGSRFENSGLHPQYPFGGIDGASNPGPMLWPERSRSRGIFQVVFYIPIGLYGGGFRPATAR